MDFTPDIAGPQLDLGGEATEKHTVPVENLANQPSDFPTRSNRGWRPWGVFLGFILTGNFSFAEDPVPMRWPQDRYQALAARSPFALATAPAPVGEPNGSFAANWFVSGLGQLNGENFVSIRARDLSVQFSLYGGETRNGVTLAGVTWSETVGKSTVVLRKGSETAKLEFNEAEVRPSPAGVAKTGLPQNPSRVGSGTREQTVAGSGGATGSVPILLTRVGGRPMSPAAARWFIKTPAPGGNTGGASSPGSLAGNSPDGFTTGGQTLTDFPGSSKAPFASSETSGMAKATEPIAEASGSAIDFQPPAGKSTTAPTGTLKGRDPRIRISPEVAKWLSSTMQNVVLERKAELIY